MPKFKLEDLFLGKNDGKKEALLRSDFENFFFDYDHQYEKIISKDNYLLLGKKGSGKTLLAEYVKKQSMYDPNWFVEINSFKQFKFQELIQLKSSDVTPNEYLSIWQWVILVNFAKLCLEDHGIPEDNNKNKLRTFFKENYSGLDISTKNILEVTKKNQIKGKILSISGQKGSDSKETGGSYLQYLEHLQKVIITLLQRSNSNYIIFYDELDDTYRNDKNHKHQIISLIKAVDMINVKYLENSCSAKAVIILRSDIYSTLNDPDLNKIRHDNALIIDWGNKVSKDCPLIKLIITKAKRSVNYLANKSDLEVFTILFPDRIKKIDPERYLLERTLFRPRDLITFLNLMIEKFPKYDCFKWNCFVNVKDKYSEYLLQETRNELSGHIEDDAMDEGITLLKNFNKSFFSFKQIENYHSKTKSQYPKVELRILLPLFFKFNIIGNRWQKSDSKKTYYSWAHRDSRAELDLNKEIVINLGLREELSLK